MDWDDSGWSGLGREIIAEKQIEFNGARFQLGVCVEALAAAASLLF